MSEKKVKNNGSKLLSNQKIGIFIDAENVEMSGYNYYGGRTDYKKLIEGVGGVRQVIRNLYYKPVHKEISDDFRRFWAELGGEIKQPMKNADPWLIIDAVTMADKLDVIVIVGGDKDYLPLIWYVKSRGCKVEVWTYRETCSQMIVDAADYFYAIDEKYLIKDNATKNSRSRRKTAPSHPSRGVEKKPIKKRQYTPNKDKQPAPSSAAKPTPKEP